MARKVGLEEEEENGKRHPVCSRRRVVVGWLVVFVVLMVSVPVYYWLTTPPTGGSCDINRSVPLLNGTLWPNGSVVDNGDVYPAGYHFQVNGTTRGCLCSLKPCIRKCCDKDQVLVSNKCSKNKGPSPFDNFSVPVYKSASEYAVVPQNHFRILYGDVCLNGKFMFMPEDTHYLLTDGRILVGPNVYSDVSEYCMESFEGSDEIHTFNCFPAEEDAQTWAMFTFYPIGMCLSIPALLATFIVYAIIPDLRNLHGKSLMCNVASLFIAYSTLTAVQLGRDNLPNTWCVSLGKSPYHLCAYIGCSQVLTIVKDLCRVIPILPNQHGMD